LRDDLLFRNRQHAHFRRHDDHVVVGDEVAGRAQAVAVERRADLAAVGEGHGGRAVPRLHQRGVVFVEGAALLIHQLVAGPGFGDQHHHGVRQRIAALHQEFERVVEAGRVRLALVGDRPELGDVVAEQLGIDVACRAAIQLTLPRSVLISPLWATMRIGMRQQRVDLAVVRDQAREGVGREALMKAAKIA
jgi:hypothetical protein